MGNIRFYILFDRWRPLVKERDLQLKLARQSLRRTAWNLRRDNGRRHSTVGSTQGPVKQTITTTILISQSQENILMRIICGTKMHNSIPIMRWQKSRLEKSSKVKMRMNIDTHQSGIFSQSFLMRIRYNLFERQPLNFSYRLFLEIDIF